MMLWGCANVYAHTSTLSFKILFFIADIERVSCFEKSITGWSALVVVAGLLVKLGAAPFHH
jgi:NADH:ubiquinone oxidoreductase subunit 2 (subunit N)